MIRLAADENFNGKIIDVLLLQRPDLDLIRVQDTELAGADDPAVLAWAAREGRILLTHDVSTMVRFAYERVSTGEAMSGVIKIGDHLPIGQILDDLLLMLECSLEGEWAGRVDFFPL